MRKGYQFFLASLLCLEASAQAPQLGANSGEYRFQSTTCITPQQSESIKTHIRQQQAALRIQGKLPAENDPSQRIQATSFAWPLQQAAGLTDPGYYGISNYVDENASYPNQLKDYNCGTRTYDQSNGYNHAGTDIFTWPFQQLKQLNNEVEIIAAAPGIIVDKNDGSPDHSCAFCTTSCLWNAVYIQHADGSVAWYGHMKSGSVTTKNIGDAVALGEKIGIVGSSGNSTGPHLHFEVYANATQTQLVDPWQGSCNNGSLYNAGLKWTVQKPYRESTLNRLQMGKHAATWGACPALENPNVATQFAPGDSIYMTTFYHDQVVANISYLSLTQPNGVVWSQWTHTAPATYDASYWYWWNLLPANAMFGTWTFKVQYGSQTVTTNFTVGAPLPITLTNFTATASGPCKASLDWTTAMETHNKGFTIQRSNDGMNFQKVGWIASAGNSISQKRYTFTDDLSANRADCKKVYYRLQQEDLDGKTSISKIVPVQWALSGGSVTVFPIPTKDNITIQGENLQRAILLDATGRNIAQINLQAYSTTHSIAALPAGKYTLQILQADGNTTIQHIVKQ